MPVDARLVVEAPDLTSRPLRTSDLDGSAGAFVYAAGTTAGVVAAPEDALLRRVLVRAGAAGATVAIGDGDTITLPASTTFDETVPGSVEDDVTIAGDVVSFYVAWIIPA